MSLILDALRKSEAERHQESLPENLAKQQALLYTSGKRNSYWPLFISLLLLFNLGVLGFFVYKFQFDTDHTGVSLTESRQTVAGKGANEQGNDIQTPGQSSVISTSATSAMSESDPVASDKSGNNQADLSAARAALAIHARESTGREQSGQPGAYSESLSDDAGFSGERTEQLSRSQTLGAEVPASDRLEPELIVPRAQREALTQQTLSAQPEVQNESFADSQEAPIASESVKSSVPHISDLNKSFLKTIPKLVFNSHIFSKDPSGRRIMINSNYLREGQSFSGITVVEITEDGVVLEKQSRQFIVPVVRDWSPES